MDLTPDALLELIARGEGRELEFKRELPVLKRLARTLCAFANTRGGMLLVGVEDDGQVVGIGQTRELKRALRECAEQHVDPAVGIEISLVQIEGKSVACCSVKASGDRPHRVRRKNDEWEVVVRAGASCRRASGATLSALEGRKAPRSGVDSFERRVLEWVQASTRRKSTPGLTATIQAFASANNIGKRRAERAFLSLERKGLLVGHGQGTGRVFHLS